MSYFIVHVVWHPPTSFISYCLSLNSFICTGQFNSLTEAARLAQRWHVRICHFLLFSFLPFPPLSLFQSVILLITSPDFKEPWKYHTQILRVCLMHTHTHMSNKAIVLPRFDELRSSVRQTRINLSWIRQCWRTCDIQYVSTVYLWTL